MSSDAVNNSEFDSGPWATISSGMKVQTKHGRVVVADGYLGLFRENGDLIASAPVASVEFKKGLLYSTTSIPKITVAGAKYQVMLSYQRSIESGLGDQQAKDTQLEDNERLVAVIRRHGGKA